MGNSASDSSRTSARNSKGRGSTTAVTKEAAPAKKEEPVPQKKEEEKLLDKYQLGRVIGQGAFGIVYSCKRRGTKEEFAVKMIDQVETPLVEIKLEVEMLKMLAHECVVKLVDVFYEKVFVCMVMEFYKGGDMIEGMQNHWKSKGMIPIPVIQNVSKMMVQGVDHLHSLSIMHRDLKGDNYLMDIKDIDNPQCRVFLSDFGTVIKVKEGERLKHKCGTKTYWAPEFYDLNYTLPADLWAIGVIMYGLVTGRFPFKGEEDCKAKKPKVPSRATKDGESFILGVLTKQEDKRLTSRQALEHKFLASIKSAAEIQAEVGKDEEEDKPQENKIREQGANAGINNRRQDLVERMESAQERKVLGTKSSKHVKDISGAFQVESARHNKMVNFGWLTPSEASGKFYDKSMAMPLKDDDYQEKFDESSQSQIQKMLAQHQVDVNAFNTGTAKGFNEFVSEVQSGQARLMLDAAKHKVVVRVVDVILLRIYFEYKGTKLYLIKETEKYPDGRQREDVHQLPGCKRYPHENGIQTCERLLGQRLKIAQYGVQVDYNNVEVFEDDEESPTFPGIRTVYRKQLYEGKITATDKGALKALGLVEKQLGKFEAQGHNGYVRIYGWMTEPQAKEKKVILRGPSEDSHLSPLVPSPVGFEEAELTAFLGENNVDVTQFGKDGTSSLAELAEELVVGDARLATQADGRIIRVVDLVILEIKKKNGDVLVEESQVINGVAKTTGRLPATKRRVDENPFWAAHRVLEKVLRVNANLIRMNPEKVILIEEEKQSAQYVNIPTLYRRRIIPCDVAE